MGWLQYYRKYYCKYLDNGYGIRPPYSYIEVNRPNLSDVGEITFYSRCHTRFGCAGVSQA